MTTTTTPATMTMTKIVEYSLFSKAVILLQWSNINLIDSRTIFWCAERLETMKRYTIAMQCALLMRLIPAAFFSIYSFRPPGICIDKSAHKHTHSLCQWIGRIDVCACCCCHSMHADRDAILFVLLHIEFNKSTCHRIRLTLCVCPYDTDLLVQSIDCGMLFFPLALFTSSS